jgi:hypothetical protein
MSFGADREKEPVKGLIQVGMHEQTGPIWHYCLSLQVQIPKKERRYAY